MKLIRAAAVVTAAALLALAAYAWRGWYSRYITNDFYTAAVLQKLGFFEAMKFHRANWSGRFSYYAIKAIAESIGDGTPRVLPALMIAFFCVAAAWSFYRIFALPSSLLAIMGGATVVFATIHLTPEVLAVGGPLIWETGLITYMLPLALYALWAGSFFGHASLRARVALSALLMFIAGGLSETSLAAQCAFAVCIVIVARVRRSSDALRVALAGLLATVIAAIIVASAPFAVRLSELPPPQPLLSAIMDAFALSYSYVGSNIFIGGASLIVVFLTGALLGMTGARIDARLALLIGGTALVSFVASLVPATWMLATGPPPRALHVSGFFVVILLTALGRHSARRSRGRCTLSRSCS